MRVVSGLGAIAVLSTVTLLCGASTRAQDQTTPQIQRTISQSPSDLSAQRPKPLFPVCDVPLVRWALALLRGWDVKETSVRD